MPFCHLWLIPVTAQWFMAARGLLPGLGADVLTVVLPPCVYFLNFGVFFFFGILCYDCSPSKYWPITLLVGILLLFPAGMILGTFRFRAPIFGLGAEVSDFQYLLSSVVTGSCLLCRAISSLNSNGDGINPRFLQNSQ